MKNCGFSEAEAKEIEKRYHDLYKVSDEHIAQVVEKARTTGYIPLAFGGRIRTPLLAKTCGDEKIIPYAAKAEARSAGNAYTQSYCILTLRAMNELRKRIWASPYKIKILPACTIHDAIYTMCHDDIEIVEWLNTNMVECMLWDELPELQHHTVKMGAELEIFWPSWANGIELDNNLTQAEIMKTCLEGMEKYREKIKT